MQTTPVKKQTYQTPRGAVRMRGFCRPEHIRAFGFDDQFRTYARYKSIYTHRSTLEKLAAGDDNNVVLALAPDDRIIGFGVLSAPEEDSRWVRLGRGVMMEVKAIEVGRQWRRYHIADEIMKILLTHSRIEQMIAYMVGYSWTWDLDGTGLSAQQYRNMLIRIFGAHGFQEFQTNEPNLCLKPENLFMGRVGSDVSEQTRKAFKWLCYGIDP